MYNIFQLGAGTALPGLVAAKVGAAVTFSDGNEFVNSLDNCREICDMNHLDTAEVVGITWGHFDQYMLQMKPVDIILGSDCFYDKKGNAICSNVIVVTTDLLNFFNACTA